VTTSDPFDDGVIDTEICTRHRTSLPAFSSGPGAPNSPRRFNPGRDDWGRVQRTLVGEAEARVVDLKRQLAALESGDKLCELT
jgi:hypothetical protein